MRFSLAEINHLKTTLSKLSTEAKIYLFGSRVDENKRGGDIDLLILSSKLTRKDIREIRIEFCKEFGEQKIDILLDTPTPSNPFTQLIFPKAIEL